MIAEKYNILLFEMLRIRMIEEKIVDLYQEQEMRCPVHLCIGQEAVSVGVCNNLMKKDIVFSNHRAHGHYLAKGGDLKKMISEIYGKSTGCCSGRGGSMHLLDLSINFLGSTPIVGGTIPIAVGAALSIKMQGKNDISTIFLGDGATEEGIFHESINFALLKNLPVLFVCENNLYSVYTPLSERQPKREIYEMVEGHGIESYQEDGNDIIKVYNLSEKATKKIREGKGPIFLEFLTYRTFEHCGPNIDDHLGYRPKEEIERWKKLSAVERFEKYLVKNKKINSNKIKDMKTKIQKEINEAFSFAKNSSFPTKSSLNDHIYAI